MIPLSLSLPSHRFTPLCLSLKKSRSPITTKNDKAKYNKDKATALTLMLAKATQQEEESQEHTKESEALLLSLLGVPQSAKLTTTTYTHMTWCGPMQAQGLLLQSL